MTKSNKILDDLRQAIQSIPKIAENPIAKLDSVNTVLHIYAIKEKIDKTKDEKLIKDYQWILGELVRHYQTLQRKDENSIYSYRNQLEE